MTDIDNKQKKSNLPGILSTLLLLALTVAIVGGGYFWFFMDEPYGDPGAEPVKILVPRGTSFYELSVELKDRGLIKNSGYLHLRYRIVSYLGLTGHLQAGWFELPRGIRPSRILNIVTSPDHVHRLYKELTIPPGFTSSHIARAVEKTGLSTAPYVESAIIDLVGEYPVLPTDRGLQGYLYPDTYKVEPPLDNSEQALKKSADTIVRIMADRFFSVLTEVEPGWKKLTREQLHETITIASVVEREYRVDFEAPMIAAVFYNRLERNIPLQSCATVVYVIEETEAGAVYRNDFVRYNRRLFEKYLEIDSPYNTYRYPGLPPGPIANSGRIGLEAAFHPSNTNALYFVIKDPQKGTHVFSESYSDHLSARKDYLTRFVVKGY